MEEFYRFDGAGQCFSIAVAEAEGSANQPGCSGCKRSQMQLKGIYKGQTLLQK